MDFVRNILLFTIAALIVGGCGGGNTTVASDNANSGTSNTTVSSNTTIGNNTSTTGSNSSSTKASVTLQWSAPSTYADTTAASLSDISGYRVYYGPSATNTPNVINITDSTATQYTVTLPSGSYYFRISAIDSSGHEGLVSTAIQKTF